MFGSPEPSLKSEQPRARLDLEEHDEVDGDAEEALELQWLRDEVSPPPPPPGLEENVQRLIKKQTQELVDLLKEVHGSLSENLAERLAERLGGELEQRLERKFEEQLQQRSSQCSEQQSEAQGNEQQREDEVGALADDMYCASGGALTDPSDPSMVYSVFASEVIEPGEVVDLDDHDAIRAERANEHAISRSRIGADALTYRRRKLQRIMDRPSFEMFFGMAILTNAVLIGAQTDYAAMHLTDETPAFYHYSNMLYSAVFLVELIFRIAAEKSEFFLGKDNRVWNYMDLIIVSTSVLEAVWEEIDRLSNGMGSGNGWQSTSQIRVLRVLRITRLIKVIRVTKVIRFIRALRVLVHQLMSTLKSLMWATVLMLLVLFLFGTFFCQAVTQELIASGYTVESLDLEEPIVRFWSTLPRAMFSLYMTMTGGVNWKDLAEPLEDVGIVQVGTFVFFISFSQLAVLNVITGVFCQTAIESAQHDQEVEAQTTLANQKVYVQQLEKIFKSIDIDKSGGLTIQEFKDHLGDDSVRGYLESMGLETSNVWALFKLLDADEGNCIDLDEFVSGCLRIKGNAKGVDLARLSYEHKWMAKRLATFIQRTDTQLSMLMTSMNTINLPINGTGSPPRRPSMGGSRLSFGGADSKSPNLVTSRSGRAPSAVIAVNGVVQGPTLVSNCLVNNSQVDTETAATESEAQPADRCSM